MTPDPSSRPDPVPGPTTSPRGEDGSLDYKNSGVDIDEAERALKGIGPLVRATHGPEVMRLERGFAGAWRRPGTDRILLASVDGVGTKLMLAVKLGRYHGVGRDIVCHCVNDVLVHGGDPLFFLDYLGTSKLDPVAFHEVIGGMSEACVELGCALIGGETAEMPGIYHGRDFDLVGAIVGDVSADRFLDGSAVRSGDAIIALGSDGLHTNGYSLARRVVAERAGDNLETRVPGGEGESWGEALLVPHRPYRNPVAPLVAAGRLHGMAHITGGGLPGNLSRMISEGLSARVDLDSWVVPPLFDALCDLGRVDERERYRAFNMGVGFVLLVDPGEVQSILEELREAGERAWVLGEVTSGDEPVELFHSRRTRG